MFDHAYSSLLEDLHDRGLLQDTLVLAMGEFGRTPKVNPAGGRDHWTNCWTTLIGGGGIKGGQVIGSSDEIGAYPKDRPIAPPDLAATVYKALGIDIETPIIGASNRPVPVVDYGHHPIAELLLTLRGSLTVSYESANVDAAVLSRPPWSG